MPPTAPEPAPDSITVAAQDLAAVNLGPAAGLIDVDATQLGLGRVTPASGAEELEPTVQVFASSGPSPATAATSIESAPTEGGRVLHTEALVVREGDLIAQRYRVTGILGRGGFGAVYSAEHTGTQQKVALKMLLSSGAGASDSETRRFYREAQVTANLKHPNTVRVFDVGETPAGALFIAMELLHGPTLESLLNSRFNAGQVLEESETIVIANGILRSLQEAHGQQLVHRDLKPANIMLADSGDDEPVVKVLDFGIARRKDSSLTEAGTALGTPIYMSPEQCTGSDIDGRSDLYSLGIILYRCVAGEPPFADPNPLTLMFQHVAGEVPDLRAKARTAVSDAFVDAVKRALSKAPADRFATARDMRQALDLARYSGADGVISSQLAKGIVFFEGDNAADVDAFTVNEPVATATGRGSLPKPADSQPSLAAAVVTEQVVSRPDTAVAPQQRGRPWPLVAGVAAALALTALLTSRLTGTSVAPAAAAATATTVAASETPKAPPQPVALAVPTPLPPAATPTPAPASLPVAAAPDDTALRAQVVAQLGELNPAMQACYERALVGEPGQQGKIKLHFSLGLGGAVADVRPEGANAELARCMTDKLVSFQGFAKVPVPMVFAQTYEFTRSNGPAAPAKASRAKQPTHKAAGTDSNRLIPD